MHLMRQGVPEELRSQTARVDPRGGRRAARGAGGSAEGRRQSGGGLSRTGTVLYLLVGVLVQRVRNSSVREFLRILAAARTLGIDLRVRGVGIRSARVTAETSVADQERSAACGKVVNGDQRWLRGPLGHPKSTGCSSASDPAHAYVLSTKTRLTGSLQNAVGTAGARAREGTRAGADQGKGA
jgi:hypothetical protein